MSPKISHKETQMTGTNIRRFRTLGILLCLLFAVIAFVWWQVPRILLGPEGHYFDSAGVRIHYTDEGEGTPLLLVHGLAYTAHLEWRQTGLIDALSRDYRVITLDNRGHGRSGKPHDAAAYGLPMVDDLVRLLDHLQIEKAHVVGLSMGGFIATKLAILHPDRVMSVAPCAAGWQEATRENRAFIESVATALERREGVGPLAELLGLDHPLEQLGVKLGIRYFNDPLALAAVVRGWEQLSVTEAALQANRVPALCIIGNDDGFLPYSEALAQHMAHLDLVVIEGRDHMNIADTGPFLEKLRAFLASHTPQLQPVPDP
jgi:pimeloyl-ACP methyl ester carboxylesterase